MNATAQAHAYYVRDTLQRPRKVFLGVCAKLAEASAVPVWLIRVATVLFGLFHAGIAIALYLLAAIWLRRPAGAWQDARPRDDGLTGHFDNLQRRLADLERETYEREAELRRAFRDLR